jgi:hypothetical protein
MNLLKRNKKTAPFTVLSPSPSVLSLPSTDNLTCSVFHNLTRELTVVPSQLAVMNTLDIRSLGMRTLPAHRLESGCERMT